MHDIEILAGYTFEQLQSFGAKARRKPLPTRTLQHWLSRLGIERDDDGLYNDVDVQIVQSLARWLRRPGNTIDGFINKLKEIYVHAS